MAPSAHWLTAFVLVVRDDDERLMLPSGGTRAAKGVPPPLPGGKQRSQGASSYQLSAFVWEQGWQAARARRLSAFVLELE